MAIPDLPPEILIGIFTRLPAKTIGRCRCISKIWRDLLSSPQFIKSHLSRQGQMRRLILIRPSRFIYSIDDCAISRKFKLESPNNCSEIAGSCDGLVLIVDKENLKFLVNPITRQQMQVPDSPLALTEGESFSMYGFGFDGINDDYKIVALSYWDTDNEHDPDCADTFVDVYSVKRGEWKRASNSPYDHAVPELSCGAFVNGAIHWLASSRESGYPSVIAAFSLADEVFDEMPPPSGVDVERFVFYKLGVVEGCLCMVDDGFERIDVWIMREYGVRESWTKLAIDGYYDCSEIRVVRFVGDDEIALLREDGCLVVYNVKTARWETWLLMDIRPLGLSVQTLLLRASSPLFYSRNHTSCLSIYLLFESIFHCFLK